MTLLGLLTGRPPRNLYDTVAENSAALLMRQYSTSFGMASLLFTEPVRTHVRNVYALVRVADEIVDNPDPHLDRAARERLLSALLDDVRAALSTGYSANLVVHAFARTACRCGIDGDLIDPFFESMRMDLDTTVHTTESFQRYVYGSAEVVGLMCLRIFLAGDVVDRRSDYELLAPGARRLGAAFQKVNFLRDLAEDHDTLHRRYFPGLDVATFCDADRDRLLADIAADLDAAGAVLPDLPKNCRRAVRVAHATFAELAARLQATPAAQIRRRRVRVPNPVKARLLAANLYGGES